MTYHKKIAITGGIGSGKSLAVSTLKNAGYLTLSSDNIVSELYEKASVRKLVKEIFPTAVSDAPDYIIDRKAVSAIAFSDKTKHKLLTDTITPLVIKEIEKRTSENSGITIVEVPLLFECGYEKLFDGVLVITRPIEERINSVLARSNLTRDEVLARMKNQVDYDSLDLSPYTIIENNGNIESLTKKVLATVKNLTK